MAEPLGSCSYPGCPEPAVIEAEVHHSNKATGESIASPAQSVCADHFYLLWRMANDPEFRRETLETVFSKEKELR